MNTKSNSNSPQIKATTKSKRHLKRPLRITACGFALALTLLFGRWAWAQSIPQPVLAIAPSGTNQLLITVTNGVSTANYELWSTPVLGNTADYPWTVAALGTNGQSSFTVPIGPYPAGFYQVLLDTNAIPLWEAADPNNPSLGILAVTIDNPTNGMVLQ
jgi:hypothetical protein